MQISPTGGQRGGLKDVSVQDIECCLSMTLKHQWGLKVCVRGGLLN